MNCSFRIRSSTTLATPLEHDTHLKCTLWTERVLPSFDYSHEAKLPVLLKRRGRLNARADPNHVVSVHVAGAVLCIMIIQGLPVLMWAEDALRRGVGDGQSEAETRENRRHRMRRRREERRVVLKWFSYFVIPGNATLPPSTTRSQLHSLGASFYKVVQHGANCRARALGAQPDYGARGKRNTSDHAARRAEGLARCPCMLYLLRCCDPDGTITRRSVAFACSFSFVNRPQDGALVR